MQLETMANPGVPTSDPSQDFSREAGVCGRDADHATLASNASRFYKLHFFA
jgi:hypothetical protein